MSRTNTVTGRSYSADPGILMYTIMNEPRGEGDPTSAFRSSTSLCAVRPALNEGECVSHRDTDDVVHNFLSDMSKFIKSLNRCHMDCLPIWMHKLPTNPKKKKLFVRSYNLLTTGLESFFGEDDTPEYFETLQPPLSRNGTTPLRSHELENIDVYCFHMWAPQWYASSC